MQAVEFNVLEAMFLGYGADDGMDSDQVKSWEFRADSEDGRQQPTPFNFR